MEFKKTNVFFFIFLSFLSCVSNENIKENTNKNNLLVCADFKEGSSSSRNFCNLMYSVDENLDTNLVKPTVCDFSTRIVYNTDEGNSYIIKLYEKGSVGMLKIKTFQNGELSFFRYCVNGEIKYSSKNIMLTKEKMLLVKARLNSLTQFFEFSSRNKLSHISIEFIENGDYRYGIAKEHLDSVKLYIESIIR